MNTPLFCTKMPKSRCVACGYEMDHTSAVAGQNIPKPGDVSLCMRCGAVMIFSEDLSLREMTPEESRKISGDPNIRQVSALIQKFHVVRKHQNG